MDYKNFSLHRHPVKAVKPSPSINLPFSRSYGSTTAMKDVGSSPPVNCLMVICGSTYPIATTTSPYVDMKHNIMEDIKTSVLPGRSVFQKSKSLPPVSHRFDDLLLAHQSKSFDQTDYTKNKHKQKYFSKIDEKLPLSLSTSPDKNHMLLKDFDKPLLNKELILNSVQETVDDQILPVNNCIDNTLTMNSEEKDLQTKPNSRFLSKNRKKKEKAKVKKVEETDTNSIIRCENKLESIKRMLAKKHLTDTENESTNVNYMKNFVTPNNNKNTTQPCSLTAVNNSGNNCEIVKAVISNAMSVNNSSLCTDDSLSIDKLPFTKSETTMEIQTLAHNNVSQTEDLKPIMNSKSTHKSGQPSNSELTIPSEVPFSDKIQHRGSEDKKSEEDIIEPINSNKEVPEEINSAKVEELSAINTTTPSMESNCVQKDTDFSENNKIDEKIKIDSEIPKASEPTNKSPISETLSKCEMGINHIKELLNRTKCRRKTNKRIADAALVKPAVEIKFCEPISSNSKNISITQCEPLSSKAEIESGSESSGCGFSDEENIIFFNKVNDSCSDDTSADENEFEPLQRQISECDSEDSFIIFVPDDTNDVPIPNICVEDDTSDDENDEETLIKCDEDEVESDSDYCSCERESVDGLPSLKGCLKKSGFRECSPRTQTTEKVKKMVSFSTDPPKVHKIIAWKHAYHMARIGHWQDYARDAERFKQRITNTSLSLDWVLKREHRSKVFFQRFRPILMRQLREEREAKRREKEALEKEIQEAKAREEELAKEKELLKESELEVELDELQDIQKVGENVEINDPLVTDCTNVESSNVIENSNNSLDSFSVDSNNT